MLNLLPHLPVITIAIVVVIVVIFVTVIALYISLPYMAAITHTHKLNDFEFSFRQCRFYGRQMIV